MNILTMHKNSPEALEIIEPGSALYDNLERTFAVNDEKLQQYFLHVAKQLEVVNFLDFQLCQDNEFRYGLLNKNLNDKEHFVFLTDYESIQSRQRQFAEIMARYRHILFLGTGIGEYLLLMADFLRGDWMLKEKVNLPEIWIIEPQPIWLKATLSFIDIHDLWSQSHLHFAVGQGWKEELAEQLISHVREDERCLIIQNPTRDLNQFVKTICHHFGCGVHGGVDLWDGNRHVHVLEKKMTRSTASPQENVTQFTPYTLTETNLERYRRNMELLEKYQHFYCDENVLSELKDCNPFIVYTKDKGLGLLINGEQGGHLPLSANDITTKNILLQFEKENCNHFNYLVAGSGDGQVLRDILDITNISNRWEGFAQIVYLIEVHPIIFKVCLYFIDFDKEIKSGRFRLFIGKNAVEKFSNYITNDSQARRPNRYFISNYYTITNLIPRIEEFLLKKEQVEIFQSKYLYQELETYYREISPNLWKKRFAENSKVKVMCITTRRSSFVQYCSRDLIEGFRENNCNCEFIIENDGLSTITIPDILKRFCEFKPDLVFLLNHLRDELNYIPPNVPFFCWVQDPVYQIFENNTLKINEFEQVYSISNKWISELQGKDKYKGVHIKFLPLGVNYSLYKPLRSKEKKYDVTYISHMSDPKELFSLYSDSKERQYSAGEKEIFKSDSSLQPLVEQIYAVFAEKLSNMEIDVINSLINDNNRKEFILDVLSLFELNEEALLFKYLSSFRSRLWKTIEACLKYRAIFKLVSNGFRVGVWGINWEKYPGLNMIANGPAENGKVINEIQNESYISLNNSMIISFHMKALEIMSSNSFMLTRRNEFDIEPITDHFVENDEIVLFGGEDELIEKAGYFINHPNEMKEISQKAYERVMKMYTYKAISERILRDFKKRFEDMC